MEDNIYSNMDVAVVDYCNQMLEDTVIRYHLGYDGDLKTVDIQLNGHGHEDLGVAMGVELGELFGRDWDRVAAGFLLICSSVAPGFIQVHTMAAVPVLETVQGWLGKDSADTFNWVDMYVELVYQDHVLFRSPSTQVQTYHETVLGEHGEALICDLHTLNPRYSNVIDPNTDPDGWVNRYYPAHDYLQGRMDASGVTDDGGFQAVAEISLAFTLACVKMIQPNAEIMLDGKNLFEGLDWDDED